MLELTDVIVSPEKTYHVMPGSIELSYTVWNVLDTEIAPKGGADLMTLKVMIFITAFTGVVGHVATFQCVSESVDCCQSLSYMQTKSSVLLLHTNYVSNTP